MVKGQAALEIKVGMNQVVDYRAWKKDTEVAESGSNKGGSLQDTMFWSHHIQFQKYQWLIISFPICQYLNTYLSTT